MRADMMETVAKDPQLEPEASLGLGSYNYYADALSPILKLFRVFLGFPGGNRNKGLEQLRSSSAKSALLGDQAKFELARILGVREGRHSEAFILFQELTARYPENPLFALSAAYQAEGDGQQSAAVEYARKAQEAAAKSEADCRERFIEASKGALDRMQATKPAGK